MSDAYIYQAAIYCESCGEKIREEIIASGSAPEDPEDESSYDSGDFPKGPFSDGGGEADGPQHCDGCGEFLENPLTEEGEEYVAEMVHDFVTEGRGDQKVIAKWVSFYRPTVEF